MTPIRDIDVLLLLALALSSKRRPADLIEIVAAIEIVHGAIPDGVSLADAFSRLATEGLIRAEAEGYTLTAEAQDVMVIPSRTSDTAKRIAGIKEKLAAWEATAQHAPIELSTKELCIAVLAHRDAVKRAGKSLLAPKPAAAETAKTRPGQRQRKPLPARRRKD